MTTEHVTRTPPAASVEDVQAVRQAKALLELREIARAFDGTHLAAQPEARREAQDALHDRIDRALGNGATMAQVAMILHDGAVPDAVPATRADIVRFRQLLGQIPAGSARTYSHRTTLVDLLDDLEASVESNRRMAESYELDRQTLHTMQRDVAGMRRLFSLPLPEGS